MPSSKLPLLNQILGGEKTLVDSLRESAIARRLSRQRKKLHAYLLEANRSKDLPLLISSEKAILKADLLYYTNSRGMKASLSQALIEIEAVERHLSLVSDPEKYDIVAQAHSLPKKRDKNDLPLDDARTSLKSHHARLANLDKSRLDKDEKDILETRQTCMATALQSYSALQIRTLRRSTS